MVENAPHQPPPSWRFLKMICILKALRSSAASIPKLIIYPGLFIPLNVVGEILP